MDYPLIGLCGRKRAGKDTAASVLSVYGWRRLALADPVREMALAIDPTIVTWLEGPFAWKMERLSYMVEEVGWEEAKRHPEVRRILQVVGTEAVRDIVGSDTWLRVAERRAEESVIEHGMPKGGFVITDVRFKNEAEWIRESNGELWKIERPSEKSGDTHPSELETDEIKGNITIYNDGTLDEFARLVEDTFRGRSKYRERVAQ